MANNLSFLGKEGLETILNQVNNISSNLVMEEKEIVVTITDGIHFIVDQPEPVFDELEMLVLGESYEVRDGTFLWAPGTYTYQYLSITLDEPAQKLVFNIYGETFEFYLYCDGVDPSIKLTLDEFGMQAEEGATITCAFKQSGLKSADWFEDNPLAPGYIANRTHYYDIADKYSMCLWDLDSYMNDAYPTPVECVTEDGYFKRGKYLFIGSRDENTVVHTEYVFDTKTSALFYSAFDSAKNGHLIIDDNWQGSGSMDEADYLDFYLALVFYPITVKKLDADFIPVDNDTIKVNNNGQLSAPIPDNVVKAKLANDQGAGAVPAVSADSTTVVKYYKYDSTATKGTLVLRDGSTGRFYINDGEAGSQHPASVKQMETYAVAKNESAQTVYITDPKGKQSYKKYTSEAYPSTIAHREASLDTIAVADPLFDAHPVTVRFGNERYFPVQKKSISKQQGWVKLDNLYTDASFGPLVPGKKYKYEFRNLIYDTLEAIEVFTAAEGMDENGNTVGCPPDGFEFLCGDPPAGCGWEITPDGRIKVQDGGPGGVNAGTLYEWVDELKPFAVFTYKEVIINEEYGDIESFDDQINNWIANNLKHGQKVFTDPAVIGKFDTTNVATIIPDPSTEDISKAKNVICPNCSWYDADGKPKVYNVSVALYVENPSGTSGYVYYNNGTWEWRHSNEMGSTTEMGDIIYPDTMEDYAGTMVDIGATITFYDVADYTEHVTSSVMIQNPQGNPSYKPYTQFAELGTIPMRSTSGSPTFEVGDPVNEQNPVTLSYAKNNYEVKRGSSTGPDNVNSMEEADTNKEYPWGNKYVRYYKGNGRFNVADPTGSLHPVNLRYFNKTIADLEERMAELENGGSTSTVWNKYTTRFQVYGMTPIVELTVPENVNAVLFFIRYVDEDTEITMSTQPYMITRYKWGYSAANYKDQLLVGDLTPEMDNTYLKADFSDEEGFVNIDNSEYDEEWGDFNGEFGCGNLVLALSGPNADWVDGVGYVEVHYQFL